MPSKVANCRANSCNFMENNILFVNIQVFVLSTAFQVWAFRMMKYKEDVVFVIYESLDSKFYICLLTTQLRRILGCLV